MARAALWLDPPSLNRWFALSFLLGPKDCSKKEGFAWYLQFESSATRLHKVNLLTKTPHFLHLIFKLLLVDNAE